MPSLPSLVIFILSAIVLLVVPGPAVFYIVARSLDQGRTAGVVSTLGIAAGTVFHVAAAAFGMSALLLSSAWAFSMVKYLGAAYLIYLGIRTLREGRVEAEARPPVPVDLPRIFREGVLVNLLNPKTALFFFAFLPQFVDPARGSAAAQILFLGTLFIMLGVISDGMWAILAGSAGSWLKAHPGFTGSGRYLSGGTYIALGLVTAVSGNGKQ